LSSHFERPHCGSACNATGVGRLFLGGGTREAQQAKWISVVNVISDTIIVLCFVSCHAPSVAPVIHVHIHVNRDSLQLTRAFALGKNLGF
jgi:hypothetical protein